ncbi:MAG: CapA family protein [Mesorhizobium sp.]|uniref:CapA family protein n=1 Tax=Mesorhizobium sp. TaxID=1871066 RepID=UPI001200D76A|nr:CapA family protein [Mesorhizobium sp.]TIP23107.1 MAG: CapA family protein [Mesorhizobium sp.]
MTIIALTGDSIIQRRLLSTTDREVKPLFDIIRSCDAAFTNLEVLPNDFHGDPALDSGGSHFGAPSWVLDELVEAGFDMFATSTNHSLDYSISGLIYALDQLNRRQLCHAGCGRDLEDARQVSYFTTPSGTIGMVACASTFARGQQASRRTRVMQGRPGLSPLRVDSVYEILHEQLEQIKKICLDLGIEQLRRLDIDLGFGFEVSADIFPFNGMNFRASTQTKHLQTPNKQDLRDILRWVEEARRMSDIVLVSIHAHEMGETEEDPAEFITEFAYAAIDSGADVVVGHGPHVLRGLEIYKQKPIFYSLGNFIGQNELVQRLPADSYDQFRVQDNLTPGALYQKRTDDDRIGFPAYPRYWQTVLPICEFEGHDLVSLTIHPVSLGLGEARHRRGRPRLASAETASTILERFSALSLPFGTNLTMDGATYKLVIPRLHQRGDHMHSEVQ